MSNTWQPIETAPVDQRGLLWIGDAGPNHSNVAFGTVREFKPYHDPGKPMPPKRYAIAEGFNGPWKITHWMPLPDPPHE